MLTMLFMRTMMIMVWSLCDHHDHHRRIQVMAMMVPVLITRYTLTHTPEFVKNAMYGPETVRKSKTVERSSASAGHD